jgi:serine phosphatase RsbU (regulator of sigma subunit)
LPSIRERILDRVSQFLAGDHNSDDVTLLLLRRKPV